MADSLNELICPACGEKMEKILTQEGLNIDICSEGCGGIWFDNREFTKFIKPQNAQEILLKLSGKKFKKVDTDAVRECPVCHSKMVKNKYSINSPIEIDECYNCGGKFLDNNELNEIRNSEKPTDKQIEDLVKNLYKSTGHVEYVASKNASLEFIKNLYNKYNKF